MLESVLNETLHGQTNWESDGFFRRLGKGKSLSRTRKCLLVVAAEVKATDKSNESIPKGTKKFLLFEW